MHCRECGAICPTVIDGCAPESQVRTRLPAGGSRIRPVGPSRERVALCSEGKCRSGQTRQSRERSFLTGDRGFESCSLQRGVKCEPDFRCESYPSEEDKAAIRPG